MANQGLQVSKIAMIGCGSMGGGMALLFAERGFHVSLQDPSEDAMDAIVAAAREINVGEQVEKHKNYESLCESLDRRKVFVWSLPHGDAGDKVLEGLMPFLRKGDLIIDCGNEHWQNTERRQGKCTVRGIRYVGCGVSGGYQAARRGPSMCPGADDETLSLVLPILRKVAAKAPDGSPCVGRIGTGGAGHYCKMIHNGIEHGMMSAIAEAYDLMLHGLNMNLDEIANEFDAWRSSGSLHDCFLVQIGVDICRKKDEQTGAKVLESVEDKVVQDFTGEEGTGIWSNTEAVELHVPAPTLTTAHYLRIASGDLHQRRQIQRTFGTSWTPHKLNRDDRSQILDDLRVAVYLACLAAYCQGLNVIDNANRHYHFNVDYLELLQVWRAGCIIRADHINRQLLLPFYQQHIQKTSDTSLSVSSADVVNPLYDDKIAKEFKDGFRALKRIVLLAIESDAVIPSLSATLEYLKYQTSTDLPTSFYEAELDYFGKHMFDRKGDDAAGNPITGKHHFEWKPA